MLRPFFYPIISVLSLMLVWAGCAAILESRYLPSPVEVFTALRIELSSGALLYHIGATLLRVIAAFMLSISIGTAIGIGMGRNTKANLFFDSWLILALSIPALVTIVFCYLWIGINEAAAITAVALNKIPNTVITIREGARAMDSALDDVAKIYRITGLTKLRHFIWPQLEPYMAASIRNGLALIWKIVLIVELLGRSNGVGFQINLAFAAFDLARILVYAICFMIIVMMIEQLFIKPWEKRTRHWRGDTI